MGSDKVLSEIYISTLITITFQLLFPGNSAAGRLAMPLENIEWAYTMILICYLPD